MFSKPLAFVLLALGCLTAAAGGAYYAARNNASDTAVAAAQQPTVTAAGPGTASATPPATSQPVAETEAAVTAAKPAEAPKAVAEAVPAEVPSVERPQQAPRVSKPTPKPQQTVARAERPSPAPPARTVPPAGVTTAPSAQNDPVPATPSVAAPPAAPVTAKPQPDPVKPLEEPQPEPVRVPQFEEVILPASAVIGLQVETPTTTERARVEDRVDARVSRDVMAAGRVAIPAGSRVIGSVTLVERGGKIKEQARLGIRFHTLVLADGTELPLHTEQVLRNGAADLLRARVGRRSQRRDAPPGGIPQREALVTRDDHGPAAGTVSTIGRP